MNFKPESREYMLENLNGKKLILASKSPRRQELLKGLGLEFEIRTKDIEEKYPPALQAEEIPRYLSRLKAEAFMDELNENEVLITSDTIVHLDGRILEKAADRVEAIEMISSLSGKTHEVITAITIAQKTKQKTVHASTKVHFSELSDAEITYYVDHYKPYDKAGAYGIQEFIGYIAVDRIEGSYFNVVGLPVHLLYQELKLL